MIIELNVNYEILTNLSITDHYHQNGYHIINIWLYNFFFKYFKKMFITLVKMYKSICKFDVLSLNTF